jgi:hypothetical protein
MTTGLVIWGGKEPVDPSALDQGLRHLIDDGNAVIASPTEVGSKRLRNLMEAACYPGVLESQDAATGRWMLSGIRRAPTTEPLIEEFEALASHTVVVLANGKSVALELVLCDLLLRQSRPPAQVMVMDLAGESDEPVPENLFGFAEATPSQVFLVPAGPIPPEECLFDALSGADGELFTALLDSDRCAPNWAKCLDDWRDATVAPGRPRCFEGVSITLQSTTELERTDAHRFCRGRSYPTDWLRQGGLARLLSGKSVEQDLAILQMGEIPLFGFEVVRDAWSL